MSPSVSRLLARLLLPLLVGLAVLVVPPPVPADAVTPVRMETVAAVAAADFDRAGAVSDEIVRPSRFALVAATAPPGAHVEVRVADGDGDWSAWADLHLDADEGPDRGGPEALAAVGRAAAAGVGSRLWFSGPSDTLQVRVREAAIDDVAVHLIDPFGLDRSWISRSWDAARRAWGGAPRRADASTTQPAIVSRSAWGADESIVRGQPAYARQVDRAFVHHTVGSNSYSQAQAPGVVRAIQAYHVNGRGWNDIGYNVLVDRFGTIYEGRAGGVDQAVIGAQAGGFNTRSTGVALMGTFTGAAPPAAAVAAVEQVIAWKADVHHFLPGGRSLAESQGSTRFPEGAVVELDTISGHRDVSTTSCPGGGTYALLPGIRSDVRTLAGDLIVDHDADLTATRVIRGDPDADALTVSAVLDPPGEWVVEVYDPEGAVLLREEGVGATARATLELAGDGWALGDYEWSVASPGRRTAFEVVAFEPPVISEVALSHDTLRADADGVLQDPLAVRAALWRDAAWTVTVTDPAGGVVRTISGVGEHLEAGWLDGVRDPGSYAVTIAAEDAAAVTRHVEVRYALFERVGTAEDPIGAAALVSGRTFTAGSADHAVIARHDVFADALAGGPLAGTQGPLLLTTPGGLDGRVIAELDRVLAPGATVYVLGGTVALSVDVADALDARYGAVRRVSGASRVATAAAVAAEVVARSGTTTAMIARAGPDDAAPWADALSGGAYGAATGIPVLLTATDRLSAETAAALNDLGIERTIVLGGTAAVSSAVAAALPEPRRISGDDRTATGVAVAEVLWAGRGRLGEVILANGYDADAWAWALAAAPLGARRGAPLLLTTPASLAGPTAAMLQRTPSIDGGLALGTARLLAEGVLEVASDLARR